VDEDLDVVGGGGCGACKRDEQDDDCGKPGRGCGEHSWLWGMMGEKRCAGPLLFLKKTAGTIRSMVFPITINPAAAVFFQCIPHVPEGNTDKSG
jgi:hypothetical protein